MDWVCCNSSSVLCLWSIDRDESEIFLLRNIPVIFCCFRLVEYVLCVLFSTLKIWCTVYFSNNLDNGVLFWGFIWFVWRVKLIVHTWVNDGWLEFDRCLVSSLIRFSNVIVSLILSLYAFLFTWFLFPLAEECFRLLGSGVDVTNLPETKVLTIYIKVALHCIYILLILTILITSAVYHANFIA